MIDKACVYCGVRFSYPKQFGTVLYCSGRCRVSHVTPTHPWEYKGCQRSDYYGRNRRKQVSAGDKVDYLVIYQYYNWTCNLCDQEIDRDLLHPDPMCGTIDHRVPLSKGGRHEWMNLYPAHLSCNLDKDTGHTDQIRTVTNDEKDYFTRDKEFV